MSIKKSLLAVSILSGVTWGTYAQDNQASSKDYLNVSMHYDGLAGETESIKLKGFSRGMAAYVMMDFPIKTSHFSFAAGAGFSSHNYFLNGQRFMMEGQENVVFNNLLSPDSENYKKMKLSVNYLEVPVELRFFSNKNNRNIGFKASVGMKVGYLIDAHTKEKVQMNGQLVTQKFKGGNDLFNQWRFAPTVRLGWGNFSVYGQYNVSQLFAPGTGPEVFPYSIGISISGL